MAPAPPRDCVTSGESVEKTRVCVCVCAGVWGLRGFGGRGPRALAQTW